MAWIRSITQQLKKYQDLQPEAKDPFVEKLKSYLWEESGLNYSPVVLQHTVKDVLRLDEDLLSFVKKFIMEKRIEPEALACEPCFTMEQFLEKTGYNPITAAIYFQMYRENEAEALKAFLMQDCIEGELPEQEILPQEDIV